MAEIDFEKNFDVSEEEFLDAAKSAMVFAILFIILVIALWGYVYLLLLSRGMNQ